MKAWILEEPRKFKAVEMEMPKFEDKVVIKVKAIGICGSELSAYKGIFPIGTYPRTLGHEIAGEVIHTPENNKNIKVGDKVALDPYLYCGKCYPCSQGKTNCCENIQVISAHCNGAHMEYFAHDINWVHKAPEHLEWIEIAMIEALSISVHGVHRAKVKKG
ncbi:MAG: alcohol dehydrogenase catalytic domain-containing protein, partial [Desulfovibrionales bacterium]|nr:alcohol dehydrogenase catalytic domain-containing protein [Desulfovibrionales bacterium]